MNGLSYLATKNFVRIFLKAKINEDLTKLRIKT